MESRENAPSFCITALEEWQVGRLVIVFQGALADVTPGRQLERLRLLLPQLTEPAISWREVFTRCTEVVLDVSGITSLSPDSAQLLRGLVILWQKVGQGRSVLQGSETCSAEVRSVLAATGIISLFNELRASV